MCASMGTYLMFMHTAEHVQEYVVGQRCSLVVFSSNLIRDNLKGLDRDVIMTQNVNYHVQMLIALVRNYGSLKNTNRRDDLAAKF